eukprot:343900-Rhodomonas_salina.1
MVQGDGSGEDVGMWGSGRGWERVRDAPASDVVLPSLPLSFPFSLAPFPTSPLPPPHSTQSLYDTPFQHYARARSAGWREQTVASFIEQGDGYSCNPNNIFLTNGASTAIQMVVPSLARSLCAPSVRTHPTAI